MSYDMNVFIRNTQLVNYYIIHKYKILKSNYKYIFVIVIPKNSLILSL